MLSGPDCEVLSAVSEKPPLKKSSSKKLSSRKPSDVLSDAGRVSDSVTVTSAGGMLIDKPPLSCAKATAGESPVKAMHRLIKMARVRFNSTLPF